MLALLSLAAFGIAFGPHPGYLDTPVNPSLWGLFSSFTPGLMNMRAVERLAVVGQGILLAVAFILLLTCLYKANRLRKMAMFFFCATAFFQLLDTSTIRASSYKYDWGVVTPSDEEARFFSQLKGSILFIPSTQFHDNTLSMNYFQSFQNLYLMNGYSARSTPIWDEIMRLGTHHGEGSAQQLELAFAFGVDYLVASRCWLNASVIERLKTEHDSVLFENDRFLVLGEFR